MHRQLLLITMLGILGVVTSRSVHRDKRDIAAAIPQQMATAANRQIGGGLSALGTLVSPLLFLMGMGSFISMLPQMFQTVLSGVGSNLIQSLIPGGGGASGGSSSRLKRYVEHQPFISEDLLDELERRFNMAVLKNERPSI